MKVQEVEEEVAPLFRRLDRGREVVNDILINEEEEEVTHRHHLRLLVVDLQQIIITEEIDIKIDGEEVAISATCVWCAYFTPNA